MALSDTDAFFARMRAEADQNRAAVLDAAVGDHVTAPRGGEPCKVAVIAPDGGRLVTHDGGTYTSRFGCVHAWEDADLRYFEWVGGPNSGEHGWYCAEDRFVVQYG